MLYKAAALPFVISYIMDIKAGIRNAEPAPRGRRKKTTRDIKKKSSKHPTKRFAYEEGRPYLRDDHIRQNQKTAYLLHRLQHALQLVHRQRRRYAEIAEGKTLLLDSEGAVIRYKFTCESCKCLFDTFYELKGHKHTTGRRTKHTTVKREIEALDPDEELDYDALVCDVKE